MFTPLVVIYVMLAGFFFMLANYFMKVLGGYHPAVLYGLTAFAILTGAYFEVQALKVAQLGHVLVFILALEIIFSLIVACVFLSETYTLRDAAGFVLVAMGLLILLDFNKVEKTASVADDRHMEGHLQQDQARLFDTMPVDAIARQRQLKMGDIPS